MARTKDDVDASKGDTSPHIPKSSAGVTKNGAEAPVKRSRGRPPKGAAKIEKKPYVPTGRPRGRPKGSGTKGTAAAKPQTTATETSDATPRRRGRPRKTAEAPASTTPKKRGRKPKNIAKDASEDENLDDAEPAQLENDDDVLAADDADDSPAKDEEQDEDFE
ncbi:hypothetical protein F66182_2021 [Fusarium sp. NRRL 66182]|nr:hypothetical protein F66182_2021 [Fusarium sp. NRRL 66182]